MSVVADKVRKRKKTQAEQADRHVLYQKSVQSADVEVAFFVDRFRELRAADPLTMREDFCGTALLCVEWCKSDPRRTAIGVDLCQDTLDWGLKNNVLPAGNDVSRRISLCNENVLTVKPGPQDVICAMNFSFCCFKTRQELLTYFKNVYAGLSEQGLLFLDLLGGTATMDVVEDVRDVEDEDFVYIWDQSSFNPIDHHLQCHIHFEFSDGSRMEQAFTYDWRLWTIPEIRELLLEAGFSDMKVYWEEFAENENDPDSDYLVGTGEYQPVTAIEQQESWLAYIVGIK
ncbi:MAG: class I SAM-dependent methyltransferase [Gammaproteobacteria bacterium]|nr:class I SAM-dependent methyltransferase [Gammaproteobacteria bacterium]